MANKKFDKHIRRTFAWWGLIFGSLVIKILPFKLLYGFAKMVSFLGYAIAAKQRKVAVDSLTIAFGKEKSRSAIKKIAKDCFYFLAKNGLESAYLIEHPKLIKQAVDFKGKGYLDFCLRRGKGAILITAHFGNFPLMMLRLAKDGYAISGIMRRMRDERVEKMFSEKRKRLGIRAIHTQPRDTCVQESLEVLRNNQLLFIQLDQNFGSGGIFVDFFGRKAATATGPVVLALRTQAAILPCFILHNLDNTYSIVFEPEYKIKQADSYQDTLLLNTQELTKIIESYIRRYPAEWGWIHRRWKSRPSEEKEE